MTASAVVPDALGLAVAAADAYRRRYGFPPRRCFFVRSDVGGLMMEGPVGSLRLWPHFLTRAAAPASALPNSDLALGAWLKSKLEVLDLLTLSVQGLVAEVHAHWHKRQLEADDDLFARAVLDALGWREEERGDDAEG